MWFQRDGAPPHWFGDARAGVTEMFGNKWIGRLGPEEQERRNSNDGEGPIPWPARSLDFSVNDFFLWGHVKGDVYKTRPADPDDLKDRIRQSIQNFPPNVLHSLQAECLKRYRACITVNGRHFEHIIG